MISRGSSSASSQTRQTKSSSWAQPSQYVSPQTRGIDPETAHQQALSAASLAFERANERVIATQDTKENKPGQALEIAPGFDNEQRLERKQSIRFTGPTAVPLRNRSITRRVAPCTSVNHGSPKGRQCILHAKTDYVSRHSESYIRASPQKEEAFTETFVSPLPTSYRKLRKARSMFTSRDSRTANFANETQQQKSQARSQLLGLHNDDGHQSGIPNLRLHRSFSFLRGEIDNLASGSNKRATQDAAIKFARNQYLYQLEQQRLKEGPSILGLKKNRKAQKAFRKTVRTGSSNSYGPSIESSGIASVERSIKYGLGYKARNLSLSLKNKLKRVFHRPSDTEDVLPIQQLDASRAHFGGYMSTSPGADQNYHYIPSPDSEVLRKANSRESLPRNTPCFLDKGTSVGSIRSIRSDIENNIGKSRVTSWTDSTAADTITSSQLMEKKRLSIIQEHGAPHQPSSKARAFADLGEIFQNPIRNISVGTRPVVPVDSQRVYSALQKRIADNQRLAFLEENGPNTEAKAEEEGTHMPEHQQVAFSLNETAIGLTDNVIRYQGTQFSKLIVFNPLIHSTADDVFQSSIHNFSNGKKEQKHFDMRTKLTPQQIAEHNEYSSNLTPKRPLREVKSAFFPSSMRIERRITSPYRRIMDSSSEDGPGIKTEIEETVQSGTGSTLIYQSAHNQVRSGSILGSASCYSRTSSGNSPKRNKSSLSLTKSDSSDGPGTAVIITARSRRTSSNGLSRDWQEWIASETAQLENHGIENMRISDAGLVKENGHKREGAQIDEEDTQIGGLGANNPKPKQPVGIVQGKAITRPIMKHQISRSIINRHPLAEIKKATMSRNIENGTPTSKINPTTPPRWSPCMVDERSSSNAKKSPSSILRPQASYASFKSEYSSSLRRQKPYIDFENRRKDLQATVSPVKPYRTTQAKQIKDEHGYSESIVRNHQMLSSNFLTTPGRTESDKKMMDSCYAPENQDFIDSTPFAAAEEEGYSPTINDSHPGANRKMVDIFLSNRRKNMRISEENGTDPAFL